MDPFSAVSEELAEIHGEISDIFRALSNGFQKLEKVKDSNRQSRQLEELTEKMRECKRLIKEFDRKAKDLESRNDPDTNKMLNEKKQSMIKELNSYVALKKQYASNLENKRIDLFDGGTEGYGEDNVLLASKTAAALKAQTEQMSWVVNVLDSIHFSIKKASQLVKELGRQVATDKCIMALLFLIVVRVIAIIIVKLVNPNNKDIKDIPGLAPPAMTRKLLWSAS
ncbi:novel plant SNARE 11-like isoform X2 [Quercus lobata]|uniref:novel plant SNARE 11-like isoform X2 n=1 Tax=Quercus lobata TaxID=97700 RepID=UPI001245977D|nr:novel plant SNARE 11-like isoform X2 [Quercus lobata]